MTRFDPMPFISGAINRLCGTTAIPGTDESAASDYHARQLFVMMGLVPMTTVANALTAGVVLLQFWSAAPWLMTFWSLALAVALGHGVSLARRGQQEPARHSVVAAGGLSSAVWHASALAVLWGMLPLILFHRVDPTHQLFLTAVLMAFMSAGAFVLVTVPAAAILFVVIPGSSTAFALLRADFQLALPLAGLLILYVGVVIAIVRGAGRLFGARLSAELQAVRQAKVDGVILREYEENVNEVIWESDAGGRLTRGGTKFAATLGLPSSPAVDTTVFGLFNAAGASPADGNGIDALFELFRRGAPFRDALVMTSLAGTTRWWALTAKPTDSTSTQQAGWRGVLSDVTAGEEAKHRLVWLAHHDPLTGLANRNKFRHYLSSVLTRIENDGHTGAVICIDLDDFKVVNDTLGHAVGDELLCEVSSRLRGMVRDGDMVARLGGDEFAVVLAKVASPDEAARISERLLAALAAPCELKGARVVARASLGVALAPRDGRDIDTLLNHADLALYAAKAGGKGQCKAFAEQMARRTRRRLRIEEGLRHALERGEMWLAFQPQVNLESWSITGFEALLRWWNPEIGTVSPAEFIPIAEECGLIQEIGQWVLEEACKQAAHWPESILVSVNVSPVQAISQDIYAIVKSALASTGLPAGRLELEITESVFMTESSAAIDALCALRRDGVRIALDDFGTGYSSLSYLQRFPFDTLKIDRSFVKDIAAQREQRAIVKMILALAEVLGMRAVAEGVEDGSQLGVLNRYRCETVQGYLVSKPIDATQVSGFLATWGLLPVQAEGIDPGATDMVPLAEGKPWRPRPAERLATGEGQDDILAFHGFEGALVTR